MRRDIELVSAETRAPDPPRGRDITLFLRLFVSALPPAPSFFAFQPRDVPLSSRARICGISLLKRCQGLRARPIAARLADKLRTRARLPRGRTGRGAHVNFNWAGAACPWPLRFWGETFWRTAAGGAVFFCGRDCRRRFALERCYIPHWCFIVGLYSSDFLFFLRSYCRVYM